MSLQYIRIYIYISAKLPPQEQLWGGGRRVAMSTAGRWDAPTELRRDVGGHPRPPQPRLRAASIQPTPPPPQPRIPAAGFQHRGDVGGGTEVRFALHEGFFFGASVCALSRFNRKWRWGERMGGGGCRKSKRGTYLSEFCAHQDEEEEGEELACRLHVSRAALSTLHADRRSAALRRSPRLAASSLPSRQGDFNYK